LTYEYDNRIENSNFLLWVSLLSLIVMRILSLELSTQSAGIALLEDDLQSTAYTWDQKQEAKQYLFTVLRDRFDEATLSNIDRFVVGLGPGSFSGIRSAIACATGLALPGNRPVEGIPSIEVLAADVVEDTQAERVYVVGDARRNRYWLAGYQNVNGHLLNESPCSLYAPHEVRDVLPPGAVIVSPDWSRIGESLSDIAGDACHLIREARAPRPTTLALLAHARIESGAALAAPVPLYLHPAVFVEPRFPANP
jgi:tRNA threonylcarbamoyl adenosine modification protein YeaZ